MIRNLIWQDCSTIADSFARQGWNKPASQYERYLAEATDGLREVVIADFDGEFAGYLTIVWTSDYPPFRERSIPEITDLNVLIKLQRRGIATRLLDQAEEAIAVRRDLAGIRVGLTADYGAAQRLYVRRGYVPDGFGLFYRDRQLNYGDNITVDDYLTLGFTKQVRG